MSIDLDALERLAKAATPIGYEIENAWTALRVSGSGPNDLGPLENDAIDAYFSALDPAPVLELVWLARVGRDTEMRRAQEALMMQGCLPLHGPELLGNALRHDAEPGQSTPRQDSENSQDDKDPTPSR